jgi:hypothetical protein
VRAKITKIDGYFAFLEQRYAGEIGSLFGAVVESPIDPFNRPRHRGDFGLRVPPSQMAMTRFFAGRCAMPRTPVSSLKAMSSPVPQARGHRPCTRSSSASVRWRGG